MNHSRNGDGGSPMQGQSGWADLAALFATRGLAARVAGPSQPINGDEDDALAMLTRWLRPSWSRRLRRIDDNLKTESGHLSALPALDRLRQLHGAQAKIDLDRVHPSWWVRAIREESPAVQRLVAATAPQSIRAAIQNGLLLDDQDLASDRPAVPEVADWVRCLWIERLVGDEADHADDSSAIVVLTRLSLRQGYRVCRLMGLIKLVVADRLVELHHRPRVRELIESIDAEFRERDLRIEVLTRRDVQSIESADVARHHHAARIGILTLARLLADCEPYRVRWALQHWPYPVAKLIRTLISREASGSSGLLQWESRILKSACDRLNLEGTKSAARSLLPSLPDQR